jgi:hypothetical protein
MAPDRIDALKRQFTGKSVLVDARRPELVRWRELPGTIKTINQSGRALVQFDGPDRGWHDLDLAWLQVVDSVPQAKSK